MVSINIEMLERITSEILGFQGYHCLGSMLWTELSHRQPRLV